MAAFTPLCMVDEFDTFLCTDCRVRLIPGDRYVGRLYSGEEAKAAPIAASICLTCARAAGWKGEEAGAWGVKE